MNTTRVFEVPFVTNIVELEEGEELIIQKDDPAKKEDKKRTWHDAFKEEEAKKKASAEAEAKKQKAAPGLNKR